jgi:hypothetical protein
VINSGQDAGQSFRDSREHGGHPFKLSAWVGSDGQDRRPSGTNGILARIPRGICDSVHRPSKYRSSKGGPTRALMSLHGDNLLVIANVTEARIDVMTRK